jgi:soluble P-type ATPase
MIELEIPGRGNYKIKHLVCDVNGTLAVDGVLLPNVVIKLQRLRDRLEIFMVTANTFGKQSLIDTQVGVSAKIIQKGDEAEQKKAFVQELGSDSVIAIGQGANDALMLKTAGIGIAILSPEGLSAETFRYADLLVPDIESALSLLENPLRLVATLRT